MAAWIKCGVTALRTGTGEQTLSLPSSTGTPKAIVGVFTKATSLGTESTHAVACIFGADDAAHSWYFGVVSEDASASADTGRFFDNQLGQPILVDGNGTATSVIDVNSASGGNVGPTTDGWIINVATNGDAGGYIEWIMVGGADLNALITDYDNLANVNQTEDPQVAPTFTTNLGLLFHVGAFTPTTGASDHVLGMGAFSYDGATISQACVCGFDDDGDATMDRYFRTRDDRVALELLGNGTVDWSLEVTTVSSSNVQVTVRDGNGTADVGALFIGLPAGVSADVGVIDAPTSTSSDWTITDPGFKPQFVGLFHSSQTLLDNSQQSYDYQGLSALDSDVSQWSVSLLSEDGVADSNAGTMVHDRWLYAYDNSDPPAIGVDIDLSSSPFNANGWTVPASAITAVDGARKWIYFAVEEEAGGVTVTPGDGALTLTGKAPTVRLTIRVQPGDGALTLTGRAPVVSVSGGAVTITREPQVGSLALTGRAPSVRVTLRVAAQVGALTLTGRAPTVSLVLRITVAPSVGALTIAGRAPFVFFTLKKIPGVGALQISGKAPIVSLSGVATVSPGVGTLALSSAAPTVRKWLRQATQVGALTLTGRAPVVSSAGEIRTLPQVGTLTLAGKAPSVAVTLRRQAGVGALTLSGVAPVVRATLRRAMSVGALTLSSAAVSVQRASVRQPTTGALAISGRTPAVVLTLRRAPSVGALTLTGRTPVVQLSGVNTIPVPLGALSLAGVAPTVSIAVRITRQPTVGSLTLVGVAPVVSIGGVRQPGVGALTLIGLVPDVSVLGGVTWTSQPSVGALSLTGLTPSIALGPGISTVLEWTLGDARQEWTLRDDRTEWTLERFQ